MCCSLWFSGYKRPECREKLSVRDRSSAHQPITWNNLLWTLHRILRASSAAESNHCVFSCFLLLLLLFLFFSDSRPWFRTTPQRLFSAAEVWQRYRRWNKDYLQCILRLRLEVQAERTEHAFCGRDGRVNAYLETGTQVDGKGSVFGSRRTLRSAPKQAAAPCARGERCVDLI